MTDKTPDLLANEILAVISLMKKYSEYYAPENFQIGCLDCGIEYAQTLAKELCSKF